MHVRTLNSCHKHSVRTCIELWQINNLSQVDRIIIGSPTPFLGSAEVRLHVEITLCMILTREKRCDLSPTGR